MIYPITSPFTMYVLIERKKIIALETNYSTYGISILSVTVIKQDIELEPSQSTPCCYDIIQTINKTV